MRRRIGDAETDDDLVEKAGPGQFDALAGEVIAGSKHELVYAGGKIGAFQQRFLATAIGVGRSLDDALARGADAIELYRNACSGPAIGRIQNMCRKSSHPIPFRAIAGAPFCHDAGASIPPHLL